MSINHYILWAHDVDALNWMWDFTYPMNVRKFGIEVEI